MPRGHEYQEDVVGARRELLSGRDWTSRAKDPSNPASVFAACFLTREWEIMRDVRELVSTHLAYETEFNKRCTVEAHSS